MTPEFLYSDLPRVEIGLSKGKGVLPSASKGGAGKSPCLYQLGALYTGSYRFSVI